jgi:hypothetical protein
MNNQKSGGKDAKEKDYHIGSCHAFGGDRSTIGAGV